MAVNISPIYTGTPDFGGFSHADGNGGTAGPLKTANNIYDGTGTVLTIYTADAANGSFVRSIRCSAAGSCVATVLRVFINNGSTNATIGNNILIGQMTLNATTASAVAATTDQEFPLGFALPAGYKINVVIGTTVSAGWFLSVIAGKYTLG